MTVALRFSRQARADLINIWRGIARHHEIAADRVIDRIEDACRHLREHPYLGKSRGDLESDGLVCLPARTRNHSTTDSQRFGIAKRTRHKLAKTTVPAALFLACLAAFEL